MLFPTPHKHALIWQGSKGNGCALFVSDTGFYGWNGESEQQVTMGHIPGELEGWHHLAVVCDGNRTSIFLDGRKVGGLNEVVETDILSIGNHWMAAHQHWMMANGLDDQFIFNRSLTAEEVNKVMHFSARP